MREWNGEVLGANSKVEVGVWVRIHQPQILEAVWTFPWKDRVHEVSSWDQIGLLINSQHIISKGFIQLLNLSLIIVVGFNYAIFFPGFYLFIF